MIESIASCDVGEDLCLGALGVDRNGRKQTRKSGSWYHARSVAATYLLHLLGVLLYMGRDRWSICS